MHKQQKRFFFDAVVLSNFALAEQIELIIKRYGLQMYVTTEVRDEITNGIVAGYHALLDIELAISQKKLTEKSMTASERKIYIDLLQYMGAGESSCIACAQMRGCIVVSDDKTARAYCAKHDVPYTGTIGILKAVSQDSTITVKYADEILKKMIKEGFYSPVQTISSIL